MVIPRREEDHPRGDSLVAILNFQSDLLFLVFDTLDEADAYVTSFKITLFTYYNIIFLTQTNTRLLQYVNLLCLFVFSILMSGRTITLLSNSDTNVIIIIFLHELNTFL